MRIVTYLPRLESIGGVELHLLETLRDLAARGHRISLLCERPGNLSAEFSSFCESVSAGPSALYSDSPARDAPRIGARAFAAAGRRPDLVYANNFSELAWAAATGALARAPIVCQLHEFRPVRQGSMSLLGGRVSRFVVASQYMRRQWSDHGLDGERIEVINCGLDPSAYPRGSDADRLRSRQALGLPPEAYVVVYLGRLIPEKGVDVLLDAWRRLELAPERARLLVVGVPPEPDAYVAELRSRAPAGCDWLPLRRDVAPVLQAADVLALPSRWEEPFGRVIIEALASGRPAVASAVGGIPEILDGEYARWLFPRGDAEALAQRLRSLQGWRARDPQLGERCAAHVAGRFGIGVAADRLEEVFSACRPRVA